jgi:phage tail-like protein
MCKLKTFSILFIVSCVALTAMPVLAKGSSPYSNYNFIVIIDDARIGGFTEVSGLATETDVVEYREGSDPNAAAKKIPGLHKVSDITLKRGIITGDTSLWDWRKMVVDGNFEDARKSGSIIMYDENNQPIAEWEFSNAWPSKIEGPSLNADGNEVAIESLTLANESLVRIR